jgi:hypothetical protein
VTEDRERARQQTGGPLKKRASAQPHSAIGYAIIALVGSILAVLYRVLNLQSSGLINSGAEE